MKLAVIGDEASKAALLAQGLREDTAIQWFDAPDPSAAATVCIDLLYEPSVERMAALTRMASSLVLINTPILATAEWPEQVVAFNGWPTFLERRTLEAATTDASLQQLAEEAFACFSKKLEWVPAVTGLIAARVLSMIINEACLALEETVSTREDIDQAMKLGTNYPYGPFEWAERIGVHKIHALLSALAQQHPRYQPSRLLQP